MKINVAVMQGGDSSERGISLLSAANVGAALDRDKYNVYFVDVHNGRWRVVEPAGGETDVDKSDFSAALDGGKVFFDYALIMIHGTPGEDGRLQAYFDMLGVAYSSCGMLSSMVTFEKEMCKHALRGTGVAMAGDVFIRRGDVVDAQQIIAKLSLPVFVKPNASGSSFGVTKVKRAEELPPAVEAAFGEGGGVLIESAVQGRELSCGVMVAGGVEYIFPVTEIIPGAEFFDYEAKYTPGAAREITPAELDPATLADVNELTIRAYKACGCRGVVRLECIVRADGVPVFLEINSIPGMTRGSIIPQQAAAMGMTLTELYDIIIADTYRPRRRL